MFIVLYYVFILANFEQVLIEFLKPKVYNAAITGITRGIIITHFSHELGEIEKDMTSIALAV